MSGDIKKSAQSFSCNPDGYKRIAEEYHAFQHHDLNCFLQLVASSFIIWGGVQLAIIVSQPFLLGSYALFVIYTVPFYTSAIHSVIIAIMFLLPQIQVESLYTSVLAIVGGHLSQDYIRYLCMEKDIRDLQMSKCNLKVIYHTLWQLPLAIDSTLLRKCFLPWFVPRNRVLKCTVQSIDAVTELREWVKQNVEETPVTTHVWPHAQKGTDSHCTSLENDENIKKAFREIFAARHFDVKPIIDMNELYITATGAKKAVTSDTVFYTSHVDGPYWWLPGASVYRLLVGLTHNEMVKTQFDLQYPSEGMAIDTNETLGFDYNRELHYIHHTEKKNTDRRSVLKLHYIVYPKGWHWYGDLCATLNTNYNTWARGNFVKTLKPKGIIERSLAWQIYATTVMNSGMEYFFGWNNLVYCLFAYALGPVAFLVMTSYRHYLLWISTFGFRKPAVAYGVFLRDANVFAIMAKIRLFYIMYWKVEFSRDCVALLCIACGLSVATLARYHLGEVRTFFGSELGFVQPKWVTSFPYGYIPHPMIVGQLITLAIILFWWNAQLSQLENLVFLGHMACHIVHMVQETLCSSY